MTEPREGDEFVCPSAVCGFTEPVSLLDPDASFAEMLRHIRHQHPRMTQTPRILWPKIKVVNR